VVHPPKPARLYEAESLDPGTIAFLETRGFRTFTDWPPPDPSLVVVGPTCHRTSTPSRLDGVTVVAAADFDTDLGTLAALLDGGPETLAVDAVAVGEGDLTAELLHSEAFFYTGWGGQS
jgi:hypothetical protein